MCFLKVAVSSSNEGVVFSMAPYVDILPVYSEQVLRYWNILDISYFLREEDLSSANHVVPRIPPVI